MIIGIDASRAFQKQRTGIEEYSYQVIKHLMNKLDGHQVVLYVKKTQNSKLKAQNYNLKLKTKEEILLPKNWRIKTINWPRFWTQIGLAWEMLVRPVDVLFIPAHTVPWIHSRNTIVTIHGLEYEIVPEAYSFWQRFYMRWSIRLSCRWTKKIIAVSENTKKDLIRLYRVPEEKIGVVYEGVSENFKFEILNLKSNLNDKILNYKPYLLFIGRLEKRKNIEGIIEAYKILKEKYNIPHKLILAGKPGYGYDNLKFKIENSLPAPPALPLQHHSNLKLFSYWFKLAGNCFGRQSGPGKIDNCKLKIIELGYIDEASKWQLMSNADAFMFPTFYEGFGLPILEAQNTGVPVVTSSIQPYKEVAGSGAVFCDPQIPQSIAEAAYKIISDEGFRSDIIKKGHENVKRFSWEKCAGSIAKLLND